MWIRTRSYIEIPNVIQLGPSDRTARVTVGDKFSKDMNIHNMVYQEPVLRPQLWNIFHGDVAIAINLVGFLETTFAREFDCFKKNRNTN